MNETLEAVARALFKSWFVDVDPVRAKAEGRQPTDVGVETAALFAGAFQNSLLGKIPKGWEVVELETIAEVIDCLHSTKPIRQPRGKPLLQLRNIRDDGLIDMTDTYWIKDEDYRLWTSRIEASPTDCVVTNVGRVGAVAQIPQGLQAALGRNMTAARCRQSFPYPTFLIQCLLSSPMKDEMALKTDAGTILDALNVRKIPRLRLVRPPMPLVSQFEARCRPLRARMEQNAGDSATLAGIRNALLPKLLSGEIRLKGAEESVETET